MNQTTNERQPEKAGEDIFFKPLAESAQTLFRVAYTPAGRQRLQLAIKNRMDRLSLASFSDYASRLRREPDEWRQLWPEALAFEGAFLRPAAQFEVARELLAEWSIMAPERTLRVLSLGCGPGYETCSLAMMLEESGLRGKNWQVDIYGLDLNAEAVSRAEAAVFEDADLHWLTELQRKKWFTPRAGGFHFKTDLAPVPHLAVGNIYEPESWPFADLIGSFDLIFARGLTLEAPPEAPRALARILRQALAPTGFIFTAPGEFLPDSSGDLHLEERSGVTYYRRGVHRVKINRHHKTRKQKAGREAAISVPNGPNTDKIMPQRERGLLEAAEKELAEGRPEAARALVNEAMLSALDDNRPSPAAWVLTARIEEALGRFDMAGTIAEIVDDLRVL